jgi:phosphoserine phosphatase
MKKLAIYDIDGTLLEGESQQHLMKYLLKNRYISYVRYLVVLPWFVAYKIGIAKDPKPALQFALKGLRGMTIENFSELLDDFVMKELRGHIFKSAKTMIEQDRANGYQILYTRLSKHFRNYLTQIHFLPLN